MFPNILNPIFRQQSNHLRTTIRIFVTHHDYEFPNFDKYRRESTKIICNRSPIKDNDFQRKVFTYGCGAAFALGSLYAAKSITHHFIKSMAASADVLALAQIEVDLTTIKLGQNVTFKWRGKPLFIMHRTPQDIERERAVPLSVLRDPAEDADRCENPDWLIVIGVCTHLGCVPIAGQGDYGGYYCPCHGSHFDAAGRVRRGPAPLNLVIPPYKFNDNMVVVG